MFEADDQLKRAKQIACARVTSIKKLNGTPIDATERKDFEMFYMVKVCLEIYLREELNVKDDKDRKVDTVEDPQMAAYMAIHHPRFYELV